jgi:hypothetical protein
LKLEIEAETNCMSLKASPRYNRGNALEKRETQRENQKLTKMNELRPKTKKECETTEKS